jgi:phosphohistidine phosphatase SixA
MKNKIISLIIIFFLTFTLKIQANENYWKPAQEGDKIILIRHALAPGRGDPKNFKIDDCSTQRNLDEIGISQSKKIGKLFKENKIKIDRVLSSQWCRCKDTARYAFKNFKEFSALNSTFSPPFDKKEKKQIKELRNYVQKWKGQGGNLILITHYVVILAVTGHAPSSGEIVVTDKNFNVLSKVSTF